MGFVRVSITESNGVYGINNKGGALVVSKSLLESWYKVGLTSRQIQKELARLLKTNTIFYGVLHKH